MIETLQQPIEIAVDIEHADRLLLQSELGPGQDLAKLVECAEPAGHRDERIGQVGHEGFALMHRSHDSELGQSLMRDLAVDEHPRNDANNLSPMLECGVCKNS